jgi:S-DNA-T family DNA segregation ATPase FtsK/SpoIIIE
MQSTSLNLVQKICRFALAYLYGFLLLYFAVYLTTILLNYGFLGGIAGSLGAYAAGVVLQLFGWGSIWVILLFFAEGFKTLFSRKIGISAPDFLLIILSTGSFCLLLSLLLGDIEGGGYFGEEIKEFVRRYFSFSWCIVISLMLLLTSCWLGLFFLHFRSSSSNKTKSLKKKHSSPAQPSLLKQSIEINNSKEINNDNIDHILPSLETLKLSGQRLKRISNYSLQDNTQLLLKTLQDFGVKGSIANVKPGPVVTLYELEPAAGVKSSRVIGLADDVARSMSAVSTRIAVIPGRNAMGIELPNRDREIVFLRDLLESKDYTDDSLKLPLALGKTIAGDPVVADLEKMPHLLVAGTTGSGKSVAINAMILSILYKLTPDQCKLIMIDPKMLELSVYEGIPHLMAPVVTEAKEAVVALKWVVKEMEERYRLMSGLGVRNITGYNKKLAGILHSNGTKSSIRAKSKGLKHMPFIMVVVDEMADLMLVAGKEIEVSVQRLAQMARAAGIHIIMATQRPSVDVITGVIKANFPTRISFAVTSRIDSRTILGEQGAERLLGMGDMLYMSGGSKIIRLHGPFVSDEEVQKVVSFLKERGGPEYADSIMDFADTRPEIGSGQDQDLYNKAISIILRDNKVSISYIQRQLRIGYNRAASLVEQMEQEKIVSSPSHTGKRTILINEHPKN